MKNIHLLPTDKPSRLFKFANQLHLDTIPKDYYKKYNIYITSDEFIEEGDFGLNLSTKNIVQYDGIKGLDSYYKKIILTTDQDLIADGVQAIDDEFLEWFVNNPSCESVVVNFNYKKFRWSELNKSQCYKIIIPQEELKSFSDFSDKFFGTTSQEDLLQQIITASKIPKKYFGIEESKQETLEKAAENYADKQSDISMRQNPLEYSKSGEELWYESKVDFIEGAKWQAERMYSEEEQLNLLNKYNEYLFTFIDKDVVGIGVEKEDVIKWFEQFKKK
jgi:hypothetical protein